MTLRSKSLLGVKRIRRLHCDDKKWNNYIEPIAASTAKTVGSLYRAIMNMVQVPVPHGLTALYNMVQKPITHVLHPGRICTWPGTTCFTDLYKLVECPVSRGSRPGTIFPCINLSSSTNWIQLQYLNWWSSYSAGSSWNKSKKDL